jgi:23S rRNA (cytosine1962-C5)-methyltransferase
MAILVNPPCVIHEDDHLLIVNKPPGWNTHSPSPYAGEGIYEWLKNRDPRWAKLAIIHRLDKETSGLLLFTKTPEANRSLTQQFTEGKVRKEYILQSNNPPSKPKLTIRSHLVRVGDHYASSLRPPLPQGEGRGEGPAPIAETEFTLLAQHNTTCTILARPRTGRTHQIRVHASENKFPILGDTLYGGAKFPRVCLHAARLTFEHPGAREIVTFENLPAFEIPPGELLRAAIISPKETNAYRLQHSTMSIDRFDEFLLAQSPAPPTAAELQLVKSIPAVGVYHKTTTPHIRGKTTEDTSPKHILGTVAPGPFPILENGVRYEINFAEGYSPGIFLDQRDNRRRLLTNYIAPDFAVSPGGLNDLEVLNTFAYTCAFSVCAAVAGARVTSLDLSRKYLDWGRRNFALNNLDPAAHDFIYGDVFDWLKRLAKKNRLFDVILLDPPTSSKSKESGHFRADRDFQRLITDTLKILRPSATLFASTNAAKWPPEDFLATIHEAIASTGRKIIREQYIPQPPDFPITKQDAAYLKTIWLQVA